MLKDIAKVLVGIIFADMLMGVWLVSANMLPIIFLGLEWSFAATMFAIAAEFIILILLIYYSWFWKAKEKKIKN